MNHKIGGNKGRREGEERVEGERKITITKKNSFSFSK